MQSIEVCDFASCIPELRTYESKLPTCLSKRHNSRAVARALAQTPETSEGRIPIIFLSSEIRLPQSDIVLIPIFAPLSKQMQLK